MVIHLPIWKPTSIVYMEEFALSRCFFFRLHQSVHHWHDMTTMSLDVACEMGDHSIYSMERNSSVLPLTAAMKHLGTWKWKHWRIIWSISKINMMTKNQGSMRVMQVNFLHPTSKTSMQQRQAFNLNPSEEREPALPTTRQIYLFHKSQGLHLKKICRTVSKTNKKWTSSLMYIIYRVSVYNYILYIYGMYYIYLFLQFIRFQNCQLIFKPKTSQTHWLTLTTCPQQPTISWAFARRSWKNRRFSAMWQFFQLEIGWVQNESCFFSNPQN